MPNGPNWGRKAEIQAIGDNVRGGLDANNAEGFNSVEKVNSSSNNVEINIDVNVKNVNINNECILVSEICGDRMRRAEPNGSMEAKC